jgi:transcriptional regulator with XRE-family HTH domain
MDAERLKILRKSYKLSQAQLAERLGKSRLTVHNWEKGKFALPADIVEQLAKADLREAVPTSTATKAEQARKAAEDKLIEYDVRSYRMLRVWPEYSNHNKAMKLFASQGRTFHPKALPLILAEFPDILTDPDGHYPVDKDTARLTLGLTGNESPTPKG